MSLSEIPGEMIEEIFSFLHGDEIFKVMNTNRRFRSVGRLCHFWKDLCDKEWKSLTNMQPLDEVETPLRIDWYEVYAERTQEYQKWSRRFSVRRWLFTDYLRMMWWLFISPHGQPLYLKTDQTDRMQKRAMQSGVILTDFFVFVPLVFCSLVFKWWGLIFLPFLLSAFILTLYVDHIKTDTNLGNGIIVGMVGLGVLSLVLAYFNDLVMMVGLLFSLSLSLAMERSMRDIITDNENEMFGSNALLISVLVITVLTGSSVGIAGLRIFAVAFVVLVLIAGGPVDGNLVSLIGVKGLIMVITCIGSVGLYFIGIWSLGREETKRLVKKVVSLVVLFSIFILNLAMIARWIMIAFFQFPIVNIPDFGGWGTQPNNTISLGEMKKVLISENISF
jgi:hypothetical protein